MKEIILTIDYELFLGGRTGTVQKCMIEPTYELAKMLDINESKMTVFWDILHYYRLAETENNFPELRNDRKLIDEQISFLVSKGHDIQLHIHPHWLDAEYSDGQWQFKYDRFNIHTLSDEENAEKIDTILGCLTISKQLIEKEVRKYFPKYNVNVFRAGGYLIEPFEKLKKAFDQNNIFVDSSVLPGMSYDNPVNRYNFINYPDRNYYHFDISPGIISEDGKFIEIPVTTIEIPVLRNLIFTIIRLLKYRNLEKGRLGTGSADSVMKKKSNFNKIITLLTKPKLTAFTTDGNFYERFNYMYRKVNNNSTMILHPKLLNLHMLHVLKEKVKDKKIKFISIKNYMNSID